MLSSGAGRAAGLGHEAARAHLLPSPESTSDQEQARAPAMAAPGSSAAAAEAAGTRMARDFSILLVS